MRILVIPILIFLTPIQYLNTYIFNLREQKEYFVFISCYIFFNLSTYCIKQTSCR